MRKVKGKVWVGFLFLFVATLVGWEGQAQSQEAYPTRPVEIICPSAAGGSYDLFGRTMALFLSKKWGVPVNVVNKPGGNYVPGLLAVYNAKPDGYTMLGDGNTYSSFLGVAVKDLPFKTMDRTYVGMVGTTPELFVVAANSPFKTLRNVADEAKRDPGNFTWAMHGAGTDSVGFAMRQLFKEVDVDPRKTKAITVGGGGPGVILVAGGHAILDCTTLASAAPSIKGGTLRGLAITSKDRNPDWPDVPTTAEAGYPTVNIMQTFGISGPPKLPAFVVAKWEKALDEILRDPEAVAKLKNIGITIVYLDSKATREFVIKETDEASKLWNLVKSGG